MYNENIRMLRKTFHMTQDDLAKLLNVKRHTVCDWESGRIEPSIENLKKLAEIFEVTIDFLVGIEDKNTEYNYQILSKYKVETELEYKLLSSASKMTSFQQQKLLTIIKALKEFNK